MEVGQVEVVRNRDRLCSGGILSLLQTILTQDATVNTIGVRGGWRQKVVIGEVGGSRAGGGEGQIQ